MRVPVGRDPYCVHVVIYYFMRLLYVLVRKEVSFS